MAVAGKKSKENITVPSIGKQWKKDLQMIAKSRWPRIIGNRIWLVAGIFMLALGALIYMTERSPADIYFTRFFGINQELFRPGFVLPGSFGTVLPAFFHVLGLSLITAAFTSGTRKQCLLICLGWFMINAVMETGQKYKDIAIRLTPDFFDRLPFLEATRPFFLNGTFDPFDIAAAGCGAFIAFLLMHLAKTDIRQ
jgi:hypothetical protein